MAGLSSLMYAGHYGGSRLGGVEPGRVIRFLARRFNVRTEHQPGPWHHSMICTDDDGRVRLVVEYSYSGGADKWYYQPKPFKQG